MNEQFERISNNLIMASEPLFCLLQNCKTIQTLNLRNSRSDMEPMLDTIKNNPSLIFAVLSFGINVPCEHIDSLWDYNSSLSCKYILITHVLLF